MKFILLIISFFSLQLAYSQSWKDMLYDNSYNFYEVCEAADKYFQTNDPTLKGSGWMTYQRWRDANESKYWPTGDRSQVDPQFAAKQYQQFLKNNPASKAIFGLGWKELGPWDIDSITGHYSAGLGRIEDMYIDPNNANRMYLGSRSGGFWRTTNGGVSWTGTTDTLFASGVNALTARPTNPLDVFINMQNSNNQYSHGIYRSNNGGDSWTQSNFNPTLTGQGGLGTTFRIYDIEYHPTIPNLVFIGTNKGLYRSDDDLTTWIQLMTSAEINEIKFHPSDPNVMYVYDGRSVNGNRNSVYVSFDSGLSFGLNNPILANANSFANIEVSADCADCLYFHSSNGIWKSLDQGTNFEFISNPGEGRGAFVVNDQDTSVMVIGSIDPFMTSDGGQNFQQSGFWSLGNSAHGGGSLSDNYFQTGVYVHADLRAAESVNGVLYLATDGFLVKSTDNGNTWVILSKGTPIRENYTLGISQSNHFCSMIGSQDNGTSILGENGWVEFYGADGMEAVIHPLNPDWMMGSFQYGGRRRTLNRGLSQSGGTPSGESGSGNAEWVAPMVYDPNDPFTLYHFSGEVWKSNDFGDNWVLAGTPTTFSGSNIQQAAVAENNSDIMVVTRTNRILLSTDAGVSYSNIFSGLPNATISDVAFDPKDDSTLIVVYDKYNVDNSKAYITTDLGQSWTNITYNLGNMPLRSVVIDHTNASTIYVGAEIGVYAMAKGDTIWSLYNPGLPNMTVRELEINYGSNTVRAATWGRGMWEYSLKDRKEYPAIMTTEISNPPTLTEPKEDIDQYVTSKISYVGTVAKVYTEWSINAPTFGNVIPMSNTQDSTWKTNIPLPNFPLGTKLFFKVFAIGSAGDTTETYKFVYTVRYNQFASVNEIEKDQFVLFPNPNTGAFTIDLGEESAEGKVIVMSVDGKKVWSQSYENKKMIQCNLDLKNGAYFVLVESNGKSAVRKIVVKK
jgi:hypothetical protein